MPEDWRLSMTTDRIPILDLQKQYQQVGTELEQRIIKVLRSGHYILGDNVRELERSVAALCGCRQAVGCANGTDALILALWALDIGPGDEVVTTPFTFAATAEAIAHRGARAVFVDIDPLTFNIDASLIEAAVTGRTRALLPVHLYGQPAEMERIVQVARHHDLKIIEDNAQAIGALYKGKPTGSFGDAGCISFYPTKNLGACGDAGMVVTSDERVAERLRVLRAHGSRVRYHHDELGVNSRLDELQAVALLTKLTYLADWNEKRRQVARHYNDLLRDIPGLILPAVAGETTPVWHQYTVRVESAASAPGVRRDQLAAGLAARGVDSMCYYPVPLHLQPAFSSLGYKAGDFPVAERVAAEVLSLPMYPELSRGQIERIAQGIRDVLGAGALTPVQTPTAAQAYPLSS